MCHERWGKPSTSDGLSLLRGKVYVSLCFEPNALCKCRCSEVVVEAEEGG
jgi:hypothetical protein